MTAFLDLLKEKIIVFDGAMGSSLQALNLSIDDWGGPKFENCSENLLYTRPDAIEKVHTSFLDVGCDVIETNSFGGSEVVLTEFGIAEKTYDVNLKAAELAKRIANDYSTQDKPRFVAGSIGPGTKLPTLGHITYRDLKNAYREQVRGLDRRRQRSADRRDLPGPAADKGGARRDLRAFRKDRRSRIPVIAQVTIETFGTMLNGTEIGAALTALEPFPIDVIGMNCGTGPKHMTDSFRYLCENSPMPVSVLPNAGLPEVKDGKQHYDETPESFAAQVEHFAKDFGANIVGGCCGTTPEHLKLVIERVGGISPKQRDAKLAPSASSIYFQQPYTQDASFLIVGERVNAQRFEEDARPARRRGLGRAGQSRQIAGERRRAHSRRQRRFRRPRRRRRYARAGFAARDERQDPADVRLDRVGKDGSRPRTCGRQVHSQFDELRGRRAALSESAWRSQKSTAQASSSA